MAIMDRSAMSADKRPIQLRTRSDLVIQETVYQGETSWIVKDPVALKYFRVRKPEKIVLKMIDGQRSYQEIKDKLQSDFPEEKIRVQDVHMLVSSFHKSGLLISNASGQSAPLQIKRNKELRQKSTQLLMSAMSLRFPGVDPERFLSWLYPKVSWFFSKTAFAICLVICAAAATLVLSNFEEFFRRLPEFQQFFNLRNIFFMASILIVTKSIHELGHGLMCKHFGGECHEIGFMPLVMTPAMYCNTSDSWLLPNKWHRIAIGAAGMYIEMVMAAICTFIWWNTQPGVIHYMALNVIFLCSVTTLLFNANPLLRYDGYYMLSDYLEIPNMGQKSKTAMLSKLREWCLGMKPVNSRLLPKRNQVSFAIYSVASFVYRWFIMIVIFWFIAQIFEPYGLAAIGHLMIAISLVGMIGIPVYKLVKFFLYPGRFREVKMIRLATSVALCLLFGWCLFLIPVPHNVRANFVVQPVDAQKVYVTQPGALTKVHFQPGERVKQGDLLAELESVDREIELERLRGELARYESQIAAYRIDAENVEDASRLIEAAIANRDAIAKQISVVERIAKELKLVAKRDGLVIPPPNIGSAPGRDEAGSSLALWSGTPFDRENRNAFLQPQTLFCVVGDPDSMKAMLVVDQADAKFVAPGQEVTLMLEGQAGNKINGEIEFVSRNVLTELPRELSITNGGPIAAKPGPGGQETTLLPQYEATVGLEDVESIELLPGFRGFAKIHVGTAPLGKRFIRYLKTVINFR